MKSETDSELIAHLIHFYKQTTHEPMQALMLATQSMQGAYAIAMIDTTVKGKVLLQDIKVHF